MDQKTQSCGPSHARPWLVLATVACGFAACDGNSRGRDASAPLSQRVSEVSVRIDSPAGGAPAVSALAFRATVTGLGASDVLGVVDPLVAPAPDDGGRCEMREVAANARSLRSQGGGVELEELANVALELGGDAPALRPTPRVYPQLASAVGGVIGEAGPIDLLALPASITVVLPDGDARIDMGVPGVPHILDGAGGPLTSATHIDPTSDLVLTVVGPARSFLEIRPFGSSVAIACPAGAGGRVQVPRELLDRVLAQSGRVPVSFEAVWRDSRLVQTQSPSSAGPQGTRLSLEARSSAVLDLRGTGEAPRGTAPSPSVP